MIAARARASSFFRHIDWVLVAAVFAISLLGLATMRSFSDSNAFFEKQIIWIALALGVLLVSSFFDYSLLRRTTVITGLFVAVSMLLFMVLSFGALVKGAQNRFNLGFLAVQPADPAKLILVALLAKYFTRRHIEIADVRHILVSGAYAFTLFALVFFQPDLGSSVTTMSCT